MRRLGNGWRQLAKEHARSYWYIPAYRCFDERYATKKEIAEMAAHAFRKQFASAWRTVIDHPRSRKAPEELRKITRNLASTGLYLLEAQDNG